MTFKPEQHPSIGQQVVNDPRVRDAIQAFKAEIYKAGFEHGYQKAQSGELAMGEVDRASAQTLVISLAKVRQRLVAKVREGAIAQAADWLEDQAESLPNEAIVIRQLAQALRDGASEPKD